MNQWFLHIDGDAFFASCEQATNWRLRGKPIAVGRERGVATAFSYEAKALGVTRGIKSHLLEKEFPQVLLVSSDYRKYGIFSRRFKAIVRRHIADMENGGIDECYARVTDITDPKGLAEGIKKDLEKETGMTFSIGVAPTKALAKLASGMNKPSGITVLQTENLLAQVGALPIDKIAGVGYRSVPKMNALAIYTIGDFITAQPGYIKDHFHRPTQELHSEICGISVWGLSDTQEPPKSISKIRAFRPATTDPQVLLSELSRNAEIVALKMRKEELESRGIVFGLKYQKHTRTSKEIVVTEPLQSASDIQSLIEKNFHQIYQKGIRYRATYVVVFSLRPRNHQPDFFGTHIQREGRLLVDTAVDKINSRYGKHVLHRASSMAGFARRSEPSLSGVRATPLIIDQDSTKALYIPYWGEI